MCLYQLSWLSSVGFAEISYLSPLRRPSFASLCFVRHLRFRQRLRLGRFGLVVQVTIDPANSVERRTLMSDYVSASGFGDCRSQYGLYLTTGTHLLNAVSHSNSVPSSVSKRNFPSSFEKEILSSASNADGDVGNPV